MPKWDCVVLGLGAMGSAATYHLAQRGVSVLGLEAQRLMGHSLGSSGGLSRITRLCYHEGHEYVPLLRRSYELFLDLERESGEKLLHRTGMLDIGPTARKAQETAQIHNLDHTAMTGAEVSKRFPGYCVPSGWPALFQPVAGILLPERCIQAHLNQAKARAQSDIRLLFGDSAKAVGWKPTGVDSGVEVHTADGQTHHARQLIVAAGSWVPSLLPELKDLCIPVRQAVGWFSISEDAKKQGAFNLHDFPCFIISRGDASWYGFPEHGEQPGFKIGKYNHLGEVVDPDQMNRSMTKADEQALRTAVEQFFPQANGPLLCSSTCLFTNTPDGHFIIDRHPCHPQVIVVSACSGHGFKMSSGIGQQVADMIVAGANDNYKPRSITEVQAKEEMAIHRICPERKGHAAFIKRSQALAVTPNRILQAS